MKKRIIPCLDIREGRVVKGKNFTNLKDVAPPLDLAKKYEADGADQLFLLDISGKDRAHFLRIVREIAQAVELPLYVGGGIRKLDDIEETLEAGATKVSITSAAIQDPHFLSEAVANYSSDRIILSIDAKQVAEDRWHAFIQGGKQDSGLEVIDWAKQGEAIGVSEILLNSIDSDGVKSGYDLRLNRLVSEALDIPVIASGGAGKLEDFTSILNLGYADAALAASVFHYDEIRIRDIKAHLN